VIGWVRVDAGIGDDPKIGLIAEALGCDGPKAIGHLVLLWARMADHARDGRLAPHSDLTLERWAGWAGRRGRFAAAVRAQLCTEDGVMRAWDKHNGAPMRKAEADAARLRAQRSGVAPTVGATVAPTVAASVEGTYVRTDERPSSSSSKRDRAAADCAAGPSGARASADPTPIGNVPALRDLVPATPEVPPSAQPPTPEKLAEIEAKRRAYKTHSHASARPG
jgi:hypothetical protein